MKGLKFILILCFTAILFSFTACNKIDSDLVNTQDATIDSSNESASGQQTFEFPSENLITSDDSQYAAWYNATSDYQSIYPETNKNNDNNTDNSKKNISGDNTVKNNDQPKSSQNSADSNLSMNGMIIPKPDISASPVYSFYQAVIEDIYATNSQYFTDIDTVLVNLKELPALSSDEINTLISYFKKYYSINIKNYSSENEINNTNAIKIKTSDFVKNNESYSIKIKISGNNIPELSFVYKARVVQVQHNYKVIIDSK